MAQDSKADLRAHFRKVRDAIPTADRARASSLVRQRLFRQESWRAASTICCYVSYGSEVETHLLIQEAVRFKKRIVVPLYDRDMKTTPLSALKRWGELQESGVPGLMEPAPAFRQLVAPSEVELVLVPGLAFDRQGGRLGQGAGYYDRLLAVAPGALRVGLAFDAQVSAEPLPHEAHDLPMHGVLTETAFLETGSPSTTKGPGAA